MPASAIGLAAALATPAPAAKQIARPDTWIKSGPPAGRASKSTRARFSVGTDVGTGLRCSLDGRRFRSFRVLAVGRGGADRTPARRAWRIAARATAPAAPPSGDRPSATSTSPTPLTPSIPSTALGQVRPYDVASPWNTPIAGGVSVLANSARYVGAIVDNNLPLTSDPDQYALPVYHFDSSTPRRTVKFSGSFSAYDNGDSSRVTPGYGATVTGIPIPDGALQSDGSDGQIVFWDPAAGVEYSFWQFARNSDGTYSATNGNRYHTTAGYYGRFADGKAGRGAGTPYAAGLVRGWEIAQGRIEHALAFAYKSPASAIVYPATKSDGAGVTGTDAPEGTRFQLDPSLTEADFSAWGLAPEAKIIARALQRYGMYVIDNSGSSKIYLEDRLTAKWHAGITRNLTAKIPLSKFRAIAAPTSS